MKTRFFIIIGAIILIAIIVAAAASGGPRAQQKGQATCTVQSEVGLAYITITNQNVPGATTTKLSVELPYSFNFTIGDTIQLVATPLPGFNFTNWEFPATGTFNHFNPISIKTTGNFAITANLMARSDQQ